MEKTHRVGTITLGTMLVIFGILFLLKLFLTGLSYEVIFRLWPIIFIALGGEILLANVKQKQLVYDKTAFVLIVILSFFAMGMAVVDFCMTTAIYNLRIY